MSFDINISKIKCSGKHGIYDHEKQNEQEFLVDIHINISDFSEDDINKTLNYEEIVNLVIKFVNNESYDLIETLAKQISEKIVFKYAKNESMLQEIKVTVYKPGTILKDRTEGISVSYREEFK
ncbi:MAG: dihydroneopterin aldolase [Candidatus Actinomarinales bacterium]|nr:MAG: dihydroneopterin aldolase [Candidatus Actinomarinales bacterium]